MKTLLGVSKGNMKAVLTAAVVVGKEEESTKEYDVIRKIKSIELGK